MQHRRPTLGQALRIGLGHLDTFSAVGAFSGVGRMDPKTAFGGVFADAAAFDKKVKLLWIGMGTAEPDPFPGAIGA